MKDKFTKNFLSKSRAEWTEIFARTVACVAPILELEEAVSHAHNKQRDAFFTNADFPEPNAEPKLMRTPARSDPSERPIIGQHTNDILAEIGYSKGDIEKLNNEQVVMQAAKSKL